MRNYPSVGIQIPDLLIPNPKIDLTKWAVIACDQFTSQPEYWVKVRDYINHSPSTLNLILPEIFLGKPEEGNIISDIDQHMRDYINNEVVVPRQGMVIVERSISTGIRHGLLLALDLEKYDYRNNSESLIRATEGTILERLPPRVRIRENAILELPHILVLIDDPEKQIIEPLRDKIDDAELLYDFDLMFESGHLQGFLINDPDHEKNLVVKLEKIIQSELFKEKYQLNDERPPLLFAMGDGNHSLATAKAVWELKKANLPLNHPLRYALVEIENIHDPGLVFEPIHRLLKGTKGDLKGELAKYFKNSTIHPCSSFEGMKEKVKASKPDNHKIGLIEGNSFTIISIDHPASQLPTGSIQDFLDNFLKQKGALEIDYIHGDEAILSASKEPGNAGFYLPSLQKSELFRTVILEGALPRKTFSMGEAIDKRFYLECRQIQDL